MTGPEARGTVLTVCFPRDVNDFAMLPAQKLLAGNCLGARYHVTSRKPTTACAFWGKNARPVTKLMHFSRVF